MKKLFVFAGVLLLAFSPVAAQNADSVSFRRADGKPVTIETVDRDSLGIDTLRRIDTVDNGLVTLRDGGRDGSMVLEVAGFGLRLGHTPMQKMEVKSPRVWLNLLSDMEFGFTQLTGVDYSGYAPGEAGVLVVPFQFLGHADMPVAEPEPDAQPRPRPAIHARQHSPCRFGNHPRQHRRTPRAGSSGRTGRQV